MSRVRVELKYSFRTRPKDLYLALSSPSWLQNWIANRVELNEQTGVFTFHWSTYSERAKIISREPNKFLKWSWVDAGREEGEFVSFRIAEMPGDDLIDLVVEDFCDSGDEYTVRGGWEKQIKRLEKLLR